MSVFFNVISDGKKLSIGEIGQGFNKMTTNEFKLLMEGRISLKTINKVLIT